MSQNIQNYFVHSPSFSQESTDFFQEQLPSNQQKDLSNKIQHLEHGRLKLTNVVVAYHTNYQANKQPEKSNFESMMSSKNQIEKSDQDMKESVWKKAKQNYDKIIINYDKKNRDKVTGIYPLQYNLPIQKREINLPISSVKASQEKQSNSLLNSKKIEDRLYPLQFQQLKKLEQLRQYKFKQEMSELRDPEIDCHSQEIIQSRPKLKIEERLLSEGKKMQQKQEQKVQEYENHLRQISTPKINQSIHSPIQIQMNDKKSKINHENEICDNYEFEETDVVERLLSFQSKYQQKKLQMEQLSKQNKLQECTFKPEITKKAQKLVRNIKVLQGSPNRKASLQLEIKNKQSTLTSFKPQINKQSEVIARKRGKSFERLTKPKTIKQQTQQSFKPTINHQSQLLAQRQQNVFDLLYQKNQEYKHNLEKKKEKIQSEIQQKEQQEYTFKPKINEYISKSFFENKNGPNDLVNSLEGFNKQKQQVHQRLLEWDRQKKQKIQIEKEIQCEQILQICTFSPIFQTKEHQSGRKVFKSYDNKTDLKMGQQSPQQNQEAQKQDQRKKILAVQRQSIDSGKDLQINSKDVNNGVKKLLYKYLQTRNIRNNQNQIAQFRYQKNQEDIFFNSTLKANEYSLNQSQQSPLNFKISLLSQSPQMRLNQTTKHTRPPVHIKDAEYLESIRNLRNELKNIRITD